MKYIHLIKLFIHGFFVKSHVEYELPYQLAQLEQSDPELLRKVLSCYKNFLVRLTHYPNKKSPWLLESAGLCANLTDYLRDQVENQDIWSSVHTLNHHLTCQFSQANFKNHSSWYPFGGSRWFQIECDYFLIFKNPYRLAYIHSAHDFIWCRLCP